MPISPSYSVRRPLPPRRRSGGFALIIALVCMGFMVLLLLSLSMLSGTELTVGKQQETLARARQNAILGLNVALGELQRTLGPDQRISAPATIRSGTTDGRSHWTGVWKSDPAGGQATDFVSWLVSVPEGDKAETLTIANAAGVSWETLPDGSTQPSNEDWVALVGMQTVDPSVKPDGVSPLVMAGSVAIGDTGHYAWWVGDEGVKARVNLPSQVLEPDVAADDEKNLMRNLLSPSHYGVQKIALNSSGEGPFADMDPNNPDLGRLLNLDQLSLLSDVSGADVGREHFHDLSLNSRGLLTNTRSGGLRYDLTHLFENDAAFTRHFGNGRGWAVPTNEGGASGNRRWDWDRTFMFIPPEATIDFDYGAPNWGIMRSFYKLNEKVESNNSLKPFLSITDTENNTKSTGFVGTHHGMIGTTGNPYQSNGNIHHINSPVHPLLSWYQLTFWLEYVRETETADDGAGGQTVVSEKWRPRLHIRPLIAVYNPYDIKLQGHNYPIYVDASPRFDITITEYDGVGGSVVRNTVSVRLNELGGNSNRIRMTIPAGEADLLPGETRLYGLDGNYPLSEATGVSKLTNDPDNDEYSYFVNLDEEFASGTPAGVRTANSIGATPKEKPADSDYWGLHPTERALLQYTRNAGDLGDAWVTFNVTFDPGGNAAGEGSASGGQFNFRFGGDQSEIAVLMNHHYRLNKEELRPKDIPAVGGWILDFEKLSADRNVFWFGTGMRTLDSSLGYLRQFVDSNPRFIISSLQQEGTYTSDTVGVISGWTGASTNGWLEESYEVSTSLSGSRSTGFFGNSRGTGGSQRVILYHVPRERPRSLGLFQHAGLSRASNDQGYVVGNSYAPPRIDPDKTQSEPANKYNVYDWSYAVNLELWDKYFLSGIPQNVSSSDLEDYLFGKRTLPNPRLRLVTVGDVVPTVAILTAADEAQTATNVAAHLVIEGAFNVNSTSVEAWKSLLASNAGLDIPIYNPSTGAFDEPETEGGAVFYRTPYNFEKGAATNDTSSKFWGSYRRLSDAELTTLAKEVADEVKARGPFGSLADFINRRPGSSVQDHRLRGALQAALDRAVNKNLSSGAVGGAAGELPGYATGYSTGEDRKGTGAPGWLLQGDLLQSIAPLLSARSDTFIIRAYGDATDPEGQILSRAWCEAVVQRVAAKVNASEAIDATDPENGHGRRFVVTSFRWIDAP